MSTDFFVPVDLDHIVTTIAESGDVLEIGELFYRAFEESDGVDFATGFIGSMSADAEFDGLGAGLGVNWGVNGLQAFLAAFIANVNNVRGLRNLQRTIAERACELAQFQHNQWDDCRLGSFFELITEALDDAALAELHAHVGSERLRRAAESDLAPKSAQSPDGDA